MEWLEVGEQDENGLYPIMHDNLLFTDGKEIYYGYLLSKYNNNWVREDNGDFVSDISHWMPLPDLPE